MRILRPSELTAYPEPRDLTAEELVQAYRLARAAFTADDLQRYADFDDRIAADDVLRELKESQARHDQGAP